MRPGLNFQDALKQYADSLNRPVVELSDEEKMQAIMNAILDAERVRSIGEGLNLLKRILVQSIAVLTELVAFIWRWLHGQ
jgi:hypothetical protein